MSLAATVVFVTLLLTPSGNFIAEAPMDSMEECERFAIRADDIVGKQTSHSSIIMYCAEREAVEDDTEL